MIKMYLIIVLFYRINEIVNNPNRNCSKQYPLPLIENIPRPPSAFPCSIFVDRIIVKKKLDKAARSDSIVLKAIS